MDTLERPTAYLGILYDRISRYSESPLEVMEEFAQRAIREGVIDDKLYGVIQSMI